MTTLNRPARYRFKWYTSTDEWILTVPDDPKQDITLYQQISGHVEEFPVTQQFAEVVVRHWHEAVEESTYGAKLDVT